MTDVYRSWLVACRPGTYVAFRRSFLWEPGIVVERNGQENNERVTHVVFKIHPADQNWKRLDGKAVTLRFSVKTPNLIAIATPAELRRADPRGRLRRFLKENKLLAVQVLEETATPIYRIVDPARNFAEVITGVVETKILPFRFSAGSFYNVMVPSKQERKVHLTTDGIWNNKVYVKPPGFEP